MTNLNQLIEQRQGENESLIKELRIVSNMINVGEKIQWGQDTTLMDKAADALESSQSITEAYRQALEDVLAGLYDVDVDKVPTIEQEAWANQYENKCEAFWYGESKGLSNVRAQIEELLGKIDKV
jgi:hypothetical protein